MHWVEEGLALGSLDDVMNRQRLLEAGICSILTVSGFPNLACSGFVWRAVPLIDGPRNPPAAIAAAVAHLAELHQKHAPVLVHCAEGKSRSVLIVSLYLSQRRGISLQQAYAHIKACRQGVDIDDALWELGTRLVGGIV
jgi:hypothetical protein